MTQFQYLDGGNQEAQDKLAEAYLFLQSSEGIAKTGVLSGLAVAQTTTASGSVLVGAGAGIVQSSRLAGADRLVNDTQFSLDVFTANPMSSLPRNDIVVFDAATIPNGLRVIVGTPSATPSDPTVPSSAIPLARLRNAASATTIPTSAIDDLRVTTTLAGVPFMQSGTASLAGDASNQRFIDVVFPVPFSSTPTIMLQGLTGQTSSSTSWNVWPTNESATGLRINGVRNNTTTMSIRWVAIGSR